MLEQSVWYSLQMEVREPRLTVALCGLLFLAGWTGSHCEDDINECLPQPCNQGMCIQNHPGYGYTCFCRPGFVVRLPTLLLLLFFFPSLLSWHFSRTSPPLFSQVSLIYPHYKEERRPCFRLIIHFIEIKVWNNGSEFVARIKFLSYNGTARSVWFFCQSTNACKRRLIVGLFKFKFEGPFPPF